MPLLKVQILCTPSGSADRIRWGANSVSLSAAPSLSDADSAADLARQYVFATANERTAAAAVSVERRGAGGGVDSGWDITFDVRNAW
ncbi:Uncharacterised protein (plasmid) [Tsukamurella tyrosinosolvens]|uniref:Uncharacterized protein n=1 Tax=Tsukamurella tyrosinosolvens TaxID=57704 RepID=A0A1H4U9R8_TSUTY|nr:hypothetical protein [Tsukamurella tyrosinosolvens]KXO92998.1 hypothetical protein AXK58_14100 [Tsukamurella tyrosinosolvens]SEC64944.1 hypothetical protein SAMN04489793_2812 [Tsukamurella tyrosinosolvens]VEH94053.1 Uncharacterised protein [Tsukamurella tyrosinosolvens]